MSTIWVGEVDSRAYCGFTTIAGVVKYLIEDRRAGRLLRWEGKGTLHTANYRGRRALTIHRGMDLHTGEALTGEERTEITAGLAAAAERAAGERWSYRHVGKMLRVYKQGNEATQAGHRVRLHWSDSPMDLAAWRRECMTALQQRINLKAGPDPDWRKWRNEWQTEMRRDARALADLRGRRIILRRLGTAEAKARFGHLITTYGDE